MIAQILATELRDTIVATSRHVSTSAQRRRRRHNVVAASQTYRVTRYVYAATPRMNEAEVLSTRAMLDTLLPPAATLLWPYARQL